MEDRAKEQTANRRLSVSPFHKTQQYIISPLPSGANATNLLPTVAKRWIKEPPPISQNSLVFSFHKSRLKLQNSPPAGGSNSFASIYFVHSEAKCLTKRGVKPGNR